MNYPGSTYKLIYDPARDALAGLYFQALQQQTFDVEFVRRQGVRLSGEVEVLSSSTASKAGPREPAGLPSAAYSARRGG